MSELPQVDAKADAQQRGTWSELAAAEFAAPISMFSIGIALHAFNAFIASTTMPAAAGDLGSAALLSWATSAFLTASIAGGAIAAQLKTRYGARAVLYLASAAFIAGTIAFGLTKSASVLIAGRALQGVSEGVVMACCYALIPEIFPKRLVPHVFAVESVVWVAAAFGGPLVAGAITDAASWRVAVMVSVPASLAFVALVPLCVPAAKMRSMVKSASMPIAAVGLIALGVFLLSLSGVAGHGLGSASIMGGAAAVLVAGVVADAKSAARILPVHAFRLSDPAGAGLLLVLALSTAEAPAAVYAAFMGQKVWSMSALEAGLLSATIAISWSLTAIAVAHAPRLTVRAFVWPAPPLLALGLAGHGAALMFMSLPAAIGGQILIGAAFGLSWARLCEHVIDTAPGSERDFAAAALPTVLSAGFAIGAAFFGSLSSFSGLRASQSATEVAAALLPLFALAAVIAGAATFVAMQATRSGDQKTA